MTAILIDLTKPTPDGVNVPVAGYLRCTPYRRRAIGDREVIADGFSVQLGAPVTFHLAATRPDECWQIEEIVTPYRVRHVAVPESADTIRYASLIDVDPATLTPTPEALAGWTVTLTEMRSLRDEMLQIAQLTSTLRGGPNG